MATSAQAEFKAELHRLVEQEVERSFAEEAVDLPEMVRDRVRSYSQQRVAQQVDAVILDGLRRTQSSQDPVAILVEQVWGGVMANFDLRAAVETALGKVAERVKIEVNQRAVERVRAIVDRRVDELVAAELAGAVKSAVEEA